MNINKKLQSLENTIKVPVAQDEYAGKAEMYIIYTYEDERPNLFGDDKVLSDTAYLQVQLIVPKTFNYMKMKHEIRDALEQMGFIITSIQTLLGAAVNGSSKIRRLIFEVNYTEQR